VKNWSFLRNFLYKIINRNKKMDIILNFLNKISKKRGGIRVLAPHATKKQRKKREQLQTTLNFYVKKLKEEGFFT
jgi:hypothetical protein